MQRLLLAAALLLWSALEAHAAAGLPERVAVPSLDGTTTLTGYLFMPATPGPWPAVVMLHGRAGPYSAAAKGSYDASTLSVRHRTWGWFWAERGYLALHVDSFGARGYPAGFPAGSYASRPVEVDEQTVRPLDAQGAAAWLRERPDVIPDRIGLHGWSNGGMAALATLASQPPGLAVPTPAGGFRAALIFYPACRAQLRQDYRPYAPSLMFVASADEEVAPAPCRELARAVHERGIGHFEMVWYDGATHAFDDPGRRRQSVAANRSARADAMARAEAFFARHLRGQ